MDLVYMNGQFFPLQKVLNVPQIRQSRSKPYIKMGQYGIVTWRLLFCMKLGVVTKVLNWSIFMYGSD